MPRYKMLIEYDGTRYNGWQRQPNASTVEEVIEKGMQQILREPVDIKGQGRTDKGVHAEGQVAHFDWPETLESDRFCFAMLGVLPKDVAVWDLEPVDEAFHARFDARQRHYRYQMVTRPSPLYRPYAEMILDPLDLDAMRKCAGMIAGTHDFESFTRSGDGNDNTECTVRRSELEVNDHLISYQISANRFLQHMVRRLIGTIGRVGRGKRSVDEFREMLEHPRTDIGGHGAPAHGLFLEQVEY